MMSSIFCFLFGMRSLKIVGRGIKKTRKSVTRLVMPTKYHTGVCGRHLPTMLGTTTVTGKQAVAIRVTVRIVRAGRKMKADQLQIRIVQTPARKRRYWRRKDSLIMLQVRL